MLWALSDLFDWAGGRFWELSERSRGIEIFGVRFLEWAADIFLGLAYFCWGARDRVREFHAWIEVKIQEIARNLEWWRLKLEWAIDDIRRKLEAVGGDVINWLKARVEELWGNVSRLWGDFYSWAQPYLGLLWDRFWDFKGWVENTAVPWLQTQVTNLGTRLDQARADLGSLIDYQRQRLDELNPFRESWEFIRNSYQKLTFTFETGWGKLGAFLADPPGSIWAWLEPILLDRLEQFLNERWDQTR